MTEPAIHNWGRFGADDQLGVLNLQTPESILAALTLVKRGKMYNLSVPLEQHGPQPPMFHKTWQVTFMTTSTHPDGYNVADDVVTMVTHSGTHMDSLGHNWLHGTILRSRWWSSRGLAPGGRPRACCSLLYVACCM